MKITKITWKLSFGVTVAAALSCPAFAQGGETSPVLYAPPHESVIKADFDRDLGRLTSVQDRRQLGELKQAAEEIEAAWRARDVQQYAALLNVAADSIASFDSSSAGYALADRYALAALKRGTGVIPLEIEVNLVMRLLQNESYSSGVFADSAEARRAKVQLFLGALQRADGLIDHQFNFDDLPALNVRVPGVPMAGMDPNAVEDPQVRAAYKAAIESNSKKAQTRLEQTKLLRLEQRLLRSGEPLIKRLYSNVPGGAEELRGLLDKYLTDTALKEHLQSTIVAITKG
jgi:hypothetical protein